jgi:cytochrome o ubiquinol oxidase subunit 1
MKARGNVETPVYRDIHMPSNTSAGFFIGVFSLALGFALTWHIWWLAIAAFIGAIGTWIARSFDNDIDYYIPADTVQLIEERNGAGSGATIAKQLPEAEEIA